MESGQSLLEIARQNSKRKNSVVPIGIDALVLAWFREEVTTRGVQAALDIKYAGNIHAMMSANLRRMMKSGEVEIVRTGE